MIACRGAAGTRTGLPSTNAGQEVGRGRRVRLHLPNPAVKAISGTWSVVTAVTAAAAAALQCAGCI